MRRRLGRILDPRWLVLLLLLVFVAFFSQQSILRHERLSSRGYDLGNIDQAIWNTAQGRLFKFTNWTGKAAIALTLDIVKAPPPIWMVYVIIGLLCPLGIFLDIRYGTDRLSGDVGLLTFFALFLRDGVTPLDDYQEVAFAIAASALVGGLAVGGVAAGAEKLFGKYRKPIEVGKDRKLAQTS